MPSSNNIPESSTLGRIYVPVPENGGELSFNASGAQEVDLRFDPSAASASREGSDLVFDLDDGGKITLSDFFELLDDSAFPDFILPDGSVVNSADFFAGSDIDFAPAGAGAAAGRLNSYEDSPGALITGLDKLGDQGSMVWSVNYAGGDEYEASDVPGGSFGFTIDTVLGDDTLKGVVFEDGRPYQHLENGDTLHAGQIFMTFSPNAGSHVSAIRLADIPEGAQIYLGDPADGGVLLTPVNGVYYLTHSNFTGEGVFIIPPADSDRDITINVEVDFTNSSVTATASGQFTVVVDAVADRPEETLGTLVADGNDEHVMGSEKVGDRFEDGFHQQQLESALDSEDNARVTVTVEVSAVFGDYQDGSETHYLLVEKLEGFDADYEIYTAEDGTEYFMVPADGHINPDTGLAVIEVEMTSPPLGSDSSFTAKTGAMAVETPTDQDPNPDNNTSVVINESPVDFDVDVVDSVLDIQLGWAYEGNAKIDHTNEEFAGMEGDVDEIGNERGEDGVASDSTGANGAPLNFSISGAAGESITEISLTFDSARGSLNYPGGADVTITNNPDGTVTYTFKNVGTSLDEVYFEPADGTHEHSDVELDYSVTVQNGKGATAEYTGSASVVVDAVADMADVIVADDESAVDYNVYSDGDNKHEYDAAKPGEKVTLNAQVNFPDTDGGEEHFVLVASGAELTGDAGAYSVHSIVVNGQTVTVGESTPTITINGVTYYKVDVGGETDDVTVQVTVSGPAQDTPHSVNVGGYTTVEGQQGEYNLENNTAYDVKPVEFDVNAVDSILTINTQLAFEGGNANKHLKWPVGDKYVSDTENAGKISLGLENRHNDRDADGQEMISQLFINIAGDSKEGGIYLQIGNSLEDITGKPLSFVSDDGTGKPLTDGQGNILYTGVSIDGGDPVSFDPPISLDGLNIYYKPDGESFSDADVNLEYAAVITDTSSGDSLVASNMDEEALDASGLQTDGLTVEGPADGHAGETTVDVDAVADMPILVDGSNSSIDYNDAGGEQQAAKPGEDITLKTGLIQFLDYADGSEQHFITMHNWAMNSGRNGGFTVKLNTGEAIVVTGTDPETGEVYTQTIYQDDSGDYWIVLTKDGESDPLLVVNSAGEVVDGLWQGNYAEGEQPFDSNWSSTLDGSKNGSFTFTVPVLNDMLQNTGGQVQAEIVINLPPDNIHSDDTFTLDVGGMAVENPTDSGEYMDGAKNNVAINKDGVEFDVALVSGGISVSVGTAYENSHKGAEKDFVAREDMSVADLMAGGAAITVNFTQPDSGEYISKAVFVADYPDSDDVPGSFIYKGQMLNQISGAELEALGITYEVSADGKVTITIKNFEPQYEGEDSLYFVPAENYDSSDVQLDYAVTVTDGDSLQDKTFTNNENLLPDDLGNNNLSEIQDNDQTIFVDAVAQKPDLGDPKGYGTMLDDGQDGFYPAAVPGGVTNITIPVNFHGDLSDGSQHHYLFVEIKPGWSLSTDASGNLVLQIGDESITIPASSITPQNQGGTMYWRVELPNDALKNSEVNITVPLNTPQDATDTTIQVGAGTWEDSALVQGGGDKELDFSNNNAFAQGEASVSFDTSGGAGLNADSGYYERGEESAHLGDYSQSPAVAINLGLSDQQDIIDYITITPDDSSLGDIYVFDTQEAYQQYLEAYAEYAEGGAAVAPDVADYASPLPPDGKLTITDGEFKGQLVFVPNTDAGAFSDQDYELGYEIKTISTESGHSTTSNGSTTIVGDAVAQKPESGENTDTDTDVKYGEETTVTVSAVFTDVTDGSTEHFVLIEAVPNWEMSYTGPDGPVTLGPEDVYLAPDGTTYYKVPVTVDKNGPDPQEAGASVTLKAPQHHHSIDGSGEIKTGGLSVESNISDGELSYHNNYAYNQNDEGISFDLSNNIGGGPHYGITIDHLYENNLPHANDPDSSEAGTEVYGNLAFQVPDGAESVVIKVPADADGKPLAIFMDGEGNELTGSYNPVSGNYEYVITAGPEGFPSDYQVKVPHNYSDEDLNIGYEYHDGGGAPVAGGTGDYTAIVDAVAQPGEIIDGSVKSDDVAGNTAATAEASFKVSVSFEDNDDSEDHFVLVEKIPGWEVLGAEYETGVPSNPTASLDVYDTVSVPQPDGTVKTYYRIKVTDLDTDQDGNINLEIKVQHTPGDVHTTDSLVDIVDGIYNYELGLGTMTQEKNMGGSGNYELDTSNNISVDTGSSVVVSYSPVDSNISFSAASINEQGGSQSGDYSKLSLSGLASALNDELTELTFKYDESKGSLMLAYDNNGTIELIAIGSETALTAEQLALLTSGGELRYYPNDFVSGHQNIGWDATVQDTVSGAVINQSGSATVVIDAVAQGSDNDMASSDLSGANEAALDGKNAIITIKTDFADNTGAEEHWVVLEHNLDYPYQGVTINGADASGSVVTKFDQYGNPYYAVQVTGQSDTVVWTVSTPERGHDHTDSLNAGTISYDPSNTGELDLSNNWKEDITGVDVSTGLVETDSASMSGAATVEDSYSQLGFTALNPDHNESAEITVTGLTGGAIYQLVDGTYVLVGAVDGVVTLDGDIAAAGGYYYKAADYASGQHTLNYNVTVTDNASGNFKTFNDQTVTVNVQAVANAGSIDAPAESSVQADKVDGQPLAEANMSFTAHFDDVDGSENHYLVFKLPDGMSLTGAEALDAETAAKMGLPVLGDGQSYWLVDVDSTLNDVTYNGSFVVDRNYVDGQNVEVYAVSEEKGNYTNDTQYAVSEDVISVEVTLPDTPLNTAPAPAENTEAVASTGNDAWSWAISSQVYPNALFGDVDGDSLHIAAVQMGNSTYDIDPVNGLEVEGQYGTLQIFQDGTYFYSPKPGMEISAGESDEFTLLAGDGYGGVSSSGVPLTINYHADHYSGTDLAELLAAGNDPAVIYAGGGNDTIIGSGGDDIIFAESGNNVIYGGGGNDVIFSGDGNDTFAWTTDDLSDGGVDQILNFDLDNDKLFFEGLFTGSSDETDLITLLDSHALTVNMGESANQMSLNYQGQTVDITLSDGCQFDQSMQEALTGDDSAAKAHMLMQILTNSGGI